MTPDEIELMERYIYQVTKRLPQSQRKEAAMELRELISDMAESESVEEALTKLGAPDKFAEQYGDHARHLIGGEYYDTYVWFLKVVLICTAASLLGVSLIDGIAGLVSGDNLISLGGTGEIILNLLYSIGITVGKCVIACVAAFGAVTAVFAILERHSIKLDIKDKKEWSINDLRNGPAAQKEEWTPKSLTPVPDKASLISRGESIVGIVFIVIFSVLLILAPHFFSVFFNIDGTLITVPVFNLERWGIILPLLLAWLGISLCDEILHLALGRYCRTVMLSSIICGILNIVLSFVILKIFPIWNPGFAEEIAMYADIGPQWLSQLAAHWNGNLASSILFLIICFATLLEIGTAIYKTVKYGMDK